MSGLGLTLGPSYVESVEATSGMRLMTDAGV